ncbi:hypothetical protein IED13_15575 [Bosea sp. SSUT16]|uniref:Uncharacterized protein n=1 Tax=Bosea spartocytisi TaxID=2773451 RepID=A0A927EEA5_9HYPH|nr:hypothetical protein [Bosea spartocytisi]MBD3847129.1 hypothetical protein [Bosea spartocytisi]MCT4474175.1 hypothetical protein [Bosea spartocytisi]
MGHWQQIGRDNAEERARRTALPRWRRLLGRHAQAALVAAAWIIAGALVLRAFRMW